MAAATDERLIYEILSAVGEIPEGNVATYGQIARLIGRPKNARLVGRVLSQAERYGDYPCHRVVDHSGRLVPGWDAQAARGRDPARRAARGPAAIPVAVRMKAQGPPHRVERRGFSESKKPRRGGLPQAAKKCNHFLSRHVRERKYFSGCKCGLCAQQTASLLAENLYGFPPYAKNLRAERHGGF
jgi:methylated-DNA-protein-cysteine methyltransferase-like protein